MRELHRRHHIRVEAQRLGITERQYICKEAYIENKRLRLDNREMRKAINFECKYCMSTTQSAKRCFNCKWYKFTKGNTK
jgi:hypothetical protein